jgi:hypothetical protein
MNVGELRMEEKQPREDRKGKRRKDRTALEWKEQSIEREEGKRDGWDGIRKHDGL